MGMPEGWEEYATHEFRAFMPEAGAMVEVLEIAPWDTVPDHKVGDIVEAGNCWRADDRCIDRPNDGEWIVLCTDRLQGVFAEDDCEFYARHTLCRVKLVEAPSKAAEEAA